MYSHENHPMWDDYPAQEYQDHYYQQDNYQTHYQHDGYYDQYQDDYQVSSNYLSNPSRQPRPQQSKTRYPLKCHRYYDPTPIHEQEEPSMFSIMKSIQETIDTINEEKARSQFERENWQAEFEQELSYFEPTYHSTNSSLQDTPPNPPEDESIMDFLRTMNKTLQATNRTVQELVQNQKAINRTLQDFESNFESEDEEDVDVIQTVSTLVVTEQPVVQTDVEPYRPPSTPPSIVAILSNTACSFSEFVLQEVDDAKSESSDEEAEIISTVSIPVIYSLDVVKTDVEVMHIADSRYDLGDISLEDFLIEFMESVDVMENDGAHEPDSFILPLMNFYSKEDDIVDSHPHMKKPKGTDLHVPHPMDHQDTPRHLWLGNLLSEGTYYYYHPHLNLSVGKDNLISSK